MSQNNGSSKDTAGKVIEFSKVRETKIEEKRRKYERVMFRNAVGAYVVSAEGILTAVELVDVSSDGMSFQLPALSKNRNAINVSKIYDFRLYFSEDTYLSLGIKVANHRPCIENGGNYLRYGCEVDNTSKSYETYKLFVEFLTKYAATAHSDSRDMKVSYF